jgi:hypothetical protein
MNKLILEEIQRMNLLSKYDNSKTLSEQKPAQKPAAPPTFQSFYQPTATNPTDTKQKVLTKNTKQKAAPAKPVATPPELKDIKAFQDWLDTKAKGWATGYKDGIINKGQNGGGYGKFGPRTQKAWATYKDQFLKDGDTATKAPPEIEGEDNTQIIDPNANDGEFGGEATTAQSTKVETPPTNDQAVTLQGNPKSAITTGQPEKPTSAIYGQQYKASDGKTYVWSGTEYKVQA